MAKVFSSLFLLLTNLYPLYGVFAFGWQITTILALYWLETVLVVGLYYWKSNAIQDYKLKTTGRAKDDFPLHLLGMYSIFILIHGALLFFRFKSSFFDFEHIWLPFFLIGLSHLLSYKINFLNNREYESKDPTMTILEPFHRVYITQFVVVVAAGSLSGAGLLIILKTIFDLAGHLYEHGSRVPLILSFLVFVGTITDFFFKRKPRLAR